MSSDEDKQEQPPAPTADDVAAELERAHAATLAAILAGQRDAEDAVKLAQKVVMQAVAGASEAMRLAQEAVRAPAPKTPAEPDDKGAAK
ncbi:hypothetical protein [Dyella acidiphila]|uniref:Uncharacterized protein n=1 Tax=Dyella acidiphila TaxID=2775866 RepID=A0ABR9G9L7_9GAMM|nr:hypothetical protein [Dyella acidiphila]MBE1160725.1 hypothetical protein [Dyella acidiphila]